MATAKTVVTTTISLEMSEEEAQGLRFLLGSGCTLTTLSELNLTGILDSLDAIYTFSNGPEDMGFKSLAVIAKDSTEE